MRGRRMATLAIVVGAAVALAACGGRGDASEAGSRISLLPSTTSKGKAWEWSSACRVAPHGHSGCAESQPELGGHAQLAGNEWNLGAQATAAATGSVSMGVKTSGDLQVQGDLTTAPPCTDHTCLAPQANTWVRGFPSVLYGINQCHAATSPRPSPALRLPASVGSIPSDLIGTTAYASTATQATYDVAYDLWLNPSDTSAPCQTDGTLEVMVWTDYDDSARLPAAMRTGSATIPFAVNGRAQSGNQAWSVYVSSVFQDGHTQPWGGTIWFVLDGAHRVNRGSVSVNLSTVLAAAGGLLRDNYRWPDFASSHWLDTIAFGMEYGPANADPYGDGPTRFSLDLRSYCLDVGASLAASSC
jgi:hypothetical protein